MTVAEPALKQTRRTYTEYLDMQARSEERLMFWDGEIFAMAGGTIQHGAIQTNLVALLWTALRGQPCRPFVGDQRLRALDSERVVYADGAVVCGPPVPHSDDATTLTNPVVVFEVLSKSTEAFDRGDKFVYYRGFPSMRSVVFIAQRTRRAEVYHRDEHGLWRLRDLGPTDELDLPEVGVRIPLSALYEGIDALDDEG